MRVKELLRVRNTRHIEHCNVRLRSAGLSRRDLGDHGLEVSDDLRKIQVRMGRIVLPAQRAPFLVDNQ